MRAGGRARSSSSPRPAATPTSSPPRCAATCRPTTSRCCRRGRRCRTSGCRPRSDTVARRLAVFRRLAHPDDRGARPVRSGCSSCPCARCCSRWSTGLGELVPVAVEPGDRVDLGGPRGAARRRGVHARRHGRAARRVRGARRDPRRLPAHRGPPAARRALGRRRRGDPLVLRRRPAQPRGRRPRPVGAAVPGDPAHRRRPRAGRRAGRAAAGRRRHARQARAGHRGRGHGVARARRWSSAMVPVLDLVPDDSLLVLVDPERVRRRAHDLVATTQEFLDGGVDVRGGRCGDARSTCRAASFATFAEIRGARGRARARAGGRCAPFSLDADAAGRGRRRDDGATGAGAPALDDGPRDGDVDGDARRSWSPRATSSGYRGEVARAVADLRVLQQAGWRLVLATEGHGPAQRMVEQLARRRRARRGWSATIDGRARGRRRARRARPRVGPGFVAPSRCTSRCSPSPTSPGRAGTSTRDMRRMPSRRRNVVDPLAAAPGRLRRARAARRRPVRRAGAAHHRPGANAATREYLVIEYASQQARPAGRPALRARPTSSTR